MTGDVAMMNARVIPRPTHPIARARACPRGPSAAPSLRAPAPRGTEVFGRNRWHTSILIRNEKAMNARPAPIAVRSAGGDSASVQHPVVLPALYSLGTLLGLALATSCLAPSMALSFFGLPVNWTTRHLYQMAAAGGLSLAAVTHSLSTAASHARLDSATYQRLNLALIHATFISCATWVSSGAKLPPLPATVMAAAALLLLLSTGVAGLIAGGADVPQLYRDQFPFVYGSANGVSRAFQIACLLMDAYAVTSLTPFLAKPILDVILPSAFQTPGGPALVAAVGVLVTVATMATVVVKLAADRARHGASTFKNLQLSTGLALALQVGFVIRAFAAGMVTNHPLSWVFLASIGFVSALHLYTFFTAKK